MKAGIDNIIWVYPSSFSDGRSIAPTTVIIFNVSLSHHTRTTSRWMKNSQKKLKTWKSLKKKYTNTLGISTIHYSDYHLRNRSALAMNCSVIIHCFEVSCKGDQIPSLKHEWLICSQLTDKQWIITQQFTHQSSSISILIHKKQWKSSCILQICKLIKKFPYMVDVM